MSGKQAETLAGTLLGEQETVTLEFLVGMCRVEKQWVVELVEYGALEPLDPAHSQWEFPAIVIKRVRMAARLRRDLELGPAGVALALDLLDQIDELRAKLGE